MNKTDEDFRIVKVGDDEIYIKDPTSDVREKAEFIKSKTFKNAVLNDVPTREKMLQILKDKGIWDEEKEAISKEKEIELERLLTGLDEGGFSLEEARKNAIRCAQLRAEILNSAAEKINMLTNTAHAYANNAEFNYIVSKCAVYNSNRNKPYFKTYDDYLNKKDSFEANAIASKCSDVLFGLPDSDDTPEKAFLQEFGFVNDKMQFINADGHLVDIDGRLINESGQFIKYVGRGDKKREVLVDKDGKEIKQKERKPFLDAKGKPVAPKKPDTEEPEQKEGAKTD